jgi:hypothetical protein
MDVRGSKGFVESLKASVCSLLRATLLSQRLKASRGEGEGNGGVKGLGMGGGWV